jgi:hypothetical protein
MRLVAALTLAAFGAALPGLAGAAPRVKVAAMDQVKSVQPVPEGTADRTAPEPEPSAPGPDRRGAWIAYGVAGGCLALSGGAALLARNKYRSLERLRGTDEYQTTYDSRSKAIRLTATAAGVLLVGGIAATGVGTWLWVNAKPPPVTLYPIPVTGGAALIASGHF